MSDQGKLSDFLVSWLGASWRTSVVGWLSMMFTSAGVALTAADYVKPGIACTLLGSTFVAYGLQLSKDKTVSNAQTPVPAHSVEIPSTIKVKSVVVDKNNP